MAGTDEDLEGFEKSLEHATVHGSAYAVAVNKCFRSLAWYSRGALMEAEADAREARDMAANIRGETLLWFASSFLAEALMAQGRLNEAERVVDEAGPWRVELQMFWFMASSARLRRLQNRPHEALILILECGRLFSEFGFRNPAMLPWRSEAALCLHLLGRVEEAREYARDELALAREWGAPGALGRALRLCGVVEGGAKGLALLQEAVSILDRSTARLEYAHALIDLGAALRRSGQRTEARQYLRRGQEIAAHCGATPAVEYAKAELRATGARPRQLSVTGVDALTPSERRIADLAAAGNSNREIAQTLFVTIKTVEVHLGHTYRKLGIRKRMELIDALR